MVCSICLSPEFEMAIPKILRCFHVFCFCCFTKWFLTCKQTCPICHQQVCIKDLKTVSFEREDITIGKELEFSLIRKNLKNHKIEILENENHAVNFQKTSIISFKKYEKLILKEIEELHCVQVSNQEIIDFCQYVNMQFISNQSLIECPYSVGKRKLLNDQKTYKEEFQYYYQSSKGFGVFIHPVDFDEILQSYELIDKVPRTLKIKICSFKKVTKSYFKKMEWSRFSHLGKNCEFVLANVDLKTISKCFNLERYKNNILDYEFDTQEAQFNMKKHHRFKKKYDSDLEDEIPNYVKIHVKNKFSHSKVKKYNDKKTALRSDYQRERAEEMFDTIIGFGIDEKSTEPVFQNIVENQLIFPELVKTEEIERDIFKKMAEKQKLEIEEKKQKKGSNAEEMINQLEEKKEDVILISKKKISQKMEKIMRKNQNC